MKEKTSISRKIFVVCNYTILTAFAVICLLPFLHVLCASFSDPYYVMKSEGLIWRIKDFTLEGYKIVLSNMNIWRGYLNTIFYCIGSTAIGMFITITGAYVASRKDFLFHNTLSLFVAVTMLFVAGTIPNYMVVKSLHMYNTVWSVMIPGCFSVFNMIMLRTAFSSVPNALAESAKLDGAGHLTIMFRIMVPLSRATIAVLIMYSVIGQWNSWFNASIYLRDPDKYPLQLVLRQILLQHQSTGSIASATSASDLAYDTSVYDELVQYCSIVVAMLPIMIGFPFVQKYFAKGVMLGAVKE